ncbi:MAG: transporter substrate-binding domain-containing protein [Clostridia bacterium]|nr:transporter substrate-binding domain-containing protein [Clostridia bacterium]
MKKILSVVLAVVLAFGMVAAFSSCTQKSDWEKIQEKGYFYCGITLYAPMNYYENDELVGFDTEFAQAVAEYLGVEAKFVTIKWPQKYLELDSGAIDAIWNGFTYGDEEGISRTEYVDFTHAYLENRQVIVTKADKLSTYNTKEAFAGLKAAAEGGSSGEAVAKELAGANTLVTPFDAQSSALMEVKSGMAEFAVIDYQMANAMVGKGDYADLSINPAYAPESEVYAIGCRKGSDFTAKLNEAIEALSENGTLAAIAEKYKLTNDLIANIGSDK